MRQRWFGATGRRVPEIALEGDPALELDAALVLDELEEARLRQAHLEGTPVVVRADSAEQLLAALRRPEVACVLVPASRAELLELDLTELTYG